MKKTISILAITVIIISMTAATAFAHGGHGIGRAVRRQARYELCTAEGCDTAGPHQHDGVWYCDHAGWQADYEACAVAGCDQLGLHEHDGTYYYCAGHTAGHGYGHGCGRGWRQ